MTLGQGYVDGLPFIKVMESGPRVGWGPALFTYSVFVEEGTIRRPRRFARKVAKILSDDRGWIRGGKVSFQQVTTNANTSLVLAKPDTVDRLCYPLNTEGEVSCCQQTKVVINIERWKHAVHHWPTGVGTYRQMVVNHEFGHRIGKPHGYCSGMGNLAPVMQQQTYGLQGCQANSWPLGSEL